MARSLLRAVVLDAGSGEEGDAGETFERKPTPIAGYEGLLSKFDQRLAASADMPVTLLMGQAPAGLNATGEADVLWWTEHIEGLQEEDLREPLNRIIRLILLSREGPTSGVEPENWSVAFRPLRQLSPLQEADRRLKIAQADTTYTNAGVLMPEEVAVSRFGGDRFGEELAIDEELRRKMEETPKAKDEEPEEAAPSDRASPARPTTA
jgi:phage-related protein (TIGR01555 family)